MTIQTKHLPRGGHAPGDLRDAFCEALELVMYGRHGWEIPEGVEFRGKQVSLKDLCGLLWNCTDIMPGEDCENLDLAVGSTYALGARYVSQQI